MTSSNETSSNESEKKQDIDYFRQMGAELAERSDQDCVARLIDGFPQSWQKEAIYWGYSSAKRIEEIENSGF